MEGENSPIETLTKGKEPHKYRLFILIAISLLLAGLFILSNRVNTNIVSNNTAIIDSVTRTAVIKIEPIRDSFILDEEIVVDVVLNTSQPVFGVDVQIIFDDELLTLKSDVNDQKMQYSEGQTASLSSLLTASSVFSSFPFAKIEQTDGGSVYKFSAIMPPNQTFEGDGVIGRIIFEAKEVGSSEVSIQFSGPGKIDGSIVSGKDSQNVLVGVEGATIVITDVN